MRGGFEPPLFVAYFSLIERLKVTGTDAGETVTARVAVTAAGVDEVFEVTDAEADRLKVVAVSEAGTVTVKVFPEVSEVSGAIVTLVSSAVRVWALSTGVELSLAVAERKNDADCPAVIAAMCAPRLVNGLRFSDTSTNSSVSGHSNL